MVAADSSMYMSDFRSNERTFDILTQVAGRAGREADYGKVVIQTYNPDSFPIECAKEQNYIKFYEKEIKLREVLKYPPFCDIIKLEVSDFDEEVAHSTINSIYENLLDKNEKSMQIFAPMPSPISRLKNRYRWRIIIKCILGNNVINKINLSINSVKTTQNTRVSVDINPNNMS